MLHWPGTRKLLGELLRSLFSSKVVGGLCPQLSLQVCGVLRIIDKNESQLLYPVLIATQLCARPHLHLQL